MAGARPQAPECRLGMRPFGVSCALLASIRSGVGAGSGVAEGLQAQCVGEEEAAFNESVQVVSKISGLPSLRLGNPTNDVTAHVGRIGGGQWPVAASTVARTATPCYVQVDG